MLSTHDPEGMVPALGIIARRHNARCCNGARSRHDPEGKDALSRHRCPSAGDPRPAPILVDKLDATKEMLGNLEALALGFVPQKAILALPIRGCLTDYDQ